MNNQTLMPRRQFLGRVTITVSGAVLGATLPASLLQARPAACLVDAAAYPDACGDWQLDDICLAYPPYALHLQPGVPASAATSAAVEAIDAHWVS
ncbi:MAG: hypothetical protein ABIP38_15005 [Steroidobacteraceae bacterium]